MCVPSYEGPNCSNISSWHGVVTLCLDGQAIEGVKMKTRGHVSEMFPKHQYELVLPRPMSLLGMAPDTRWVLAASFIDTSFQRNPLAFDIYRLLGGWAPSLRYVNVRWHGVDYGLYYVGEQPEVSESRIRLPDTQPANPAESAFLLTADWKKAGVLAIKTPNTSTYFNVIYPAESQVSAPRRSFLQQLLDEVDRRALEKSALAGQGSLEEILDFPSFVRYFIVQELAKDVDGYAFSNFMSVQAGKLYHASPWDFDLAFDFDCTGKYFTNIFTGKVSLGVEGWNVENSRSMGYWTGKDGWGDGIWDFGSNKRQLFTNVWRHPRFARAFAATWREARRGPLVDSVLLALVQRRSAEIEASAERDLGLWRNSNRTAFWEACHPEDSRDFRSATRHLGGYLQERARWMDAHVGELLAE